MTETTAKSRLKQRILQKLQNVTSQSARCIGNVLETATFFYVPSISASTALILEWIKCCPRSLIVTKKPLTSHKMLKKVSNLGFFSDIVHDQHNGYLVTYDQLPALPDWAKTLSAVFEDVGDLKLFEENTGRDVLGSSMFKFAVTSSPFIFAQFLQFRPGCFVPFVPGQYIRRSYFGAMLGTASIIYHPGYLESPQALDYLSYLSAICDQHTMKLFLDIFKRNLFDSRYFRRFIGVDRDFTSEKLVDLFRSLKYFEGSPVYIYFDDNTDRLIAYEILKEMSHSKASGAYCGLSSLSRSSSRGSTTNANAVPVDVRGLDRISSFFNHPSDSSTLVLQGKLLEESNISVDLKLVTDISGHHNSAGANIIFFDYYPFLSRCPRVYLCPFSHNALFKKMIECDNNIRRSLSEGQDSTSARPLARKNTIKQSFHRFQVLGVLSNEIAGDTTMNDFVVKVENIGSKVLVTTRSFSDELSASFNLLDAIKQPILLPRGSIAHGPLFLLSDGFEMCTITSFKSLVNSKMFLGDGFLAMMEKSVCFYSFSEDRNLRFDLTAEDIDEYAILSIVKAPDGVLSIKTGDTSSTSVSDRRHADSNENHEMAKYNGTPKHCQGFTFSPENVPRMCLMMSLALKIPPKIYSVEPSEDIAKRLAGNEDISDKCTFFSNLEWKRLSSDEFSELTDRFDIRISVPLFQSSPAVNLPAQPVQRTSPISNGWGENPYAFLDSSIVRSLVKSLGNYRIRVVCSELSRTNAQLSLEQVQEYFHRFDFNFYYPVMCLVSRKGRFLVGKLTEPDLDYISQQHIPSYCESLDRALRSRFEPFNVHVNYNVANTTKEGGSDRIMVKTAVVTPLRVVFNYESVSESNRVLRRFDPDKFLRISIREEDGKSRFAAACTNSDNVYEHFRTIMLGGIVVGLRKYFFLTMTASQLKTHGSWFVTPYEHEGILVGADHIKSWLGDFNNIKNIGKYAVRVGLALSSTTRACTVEDFIEVNDIERNSHCFTDGVGLITQRCANLVSSALGLNHVPSAFQIRFAGYKGVLVTHPWLDDESRFRGWLSKSSGVVRGYGKYSTSSGGYSDTDSIVHELGVPGVVFRKSMNKFESSHRVLEIVTTSKSCDFYLNRQIILTLEGLGVPPQVFLDLQDKYVFRVLSEMHSDFSSFIKKHCHVAFNVSSDLVFFRKLQSPILSEILGDLSSKSKIFVGEGRGAMGIIDDLDVLEENQVFFMFKKREHEDMESMADYGAYAVPNCQCIVAKNPVMHPGDIRVVRCVDNPRLHYLKDVIVFSQRGQRPVFNQCSGSDLDGDIFLLSWCKKLIPKATFKPYDYRDSSGLVKDRVLLSDIVNFYIRHMRLYQLGQIANSYLATSDKYTIFNERSLKLSEIFNKSIDYVKTGNLASVPDDLRPAEFPDFMEKVPSYYSKRALGMLYRRSCFDLSGISYCECNRCTLKEIRGQCKWKEFILMGSGAKTREIVGNPLYNVEDLDIFRSYKCDVLGLADRYGAANEEKLFCYRGEDAALVSRELRSLVSRYLGLLKTRESLRMAEIGKCQNLNSIELLCGDAYRLGSTVRSGVVRNGNSRFIFNAKIHLVDPGASCDGSIFLVEESNEHDFYENRFDAKEIAVRANTLNYERFATSLDVRRRDVLGEAFNLIVLCKLYKITEIDRILDLLEKVSSRMARSDRLEFFRSALPDSNNVLFKIAALVVLDLSIVKKNLLLREKELFVASEAPKPCGTCKRVCLVVSGMFDGNDDVEFVRENDAFVPSLKNKGVCSPDYYKDTLRDFLVNILYSGENAKFVSSSVRSKTQPANRSKKWKYISGCGSNDTICETTDERKGNQFVDSILAAVKKSESSKPTVPRVFYELVFTPGKFRFSSIPEHHLNDCFSIRTVERLLASKDPSNSFSFDFVVGHKALDHQSRINASSDADKIRGKDVRESLSFVYESSGYSVHYTDSVLIRITKDRKIVGKAFIVNDSFRNDLQAEFIRSEIVFDGNTIDMLEEHEHFMKHPNLVISAPNHYKLGSMHSKCVGIKLEKISVLVDDDGFSVVRQELYAEPESKEVGGILELKVDRVSCFAAREFVIDSVDGTDFDRAFSKLWKLYLTML